MKIAAALVAACVQSSAASYHLPEPLIWSIMRVEGGEVGTASHNSNGTDDLGPMQVNTTWLPRLAEWYSSAPQLKGMGVKQRQVALRRMLLTDACFNVSIGSYILRRGMDEAGSNDFWGGVGNYHSHTTHLKRRYQFLVAQAAKRLYGESIIGGKSFNRPDLSAIPFVDTSSKAGSAEKPGPKTGAKGREVSWRFSIETVDPIQPQRRPQVQTALLAGTVMPSTKPSQAADEPKVSCVMGARWDKGAGTCRFIE